jgi:hypothetical protein
LQKKLTSQETRDLKLEAEVLSQKMALRSEFIKIKEQKYILAVNQCEREKMILTVSVGSIHLTSKFGKKI